VVDVTHDGNHRRPRLKRHILVLGNLSLRGRHPDRPAWRQALWPISSTTIIAVSWSSTWLMVTIEPIFIMTLMTSVALTAILCARSETEMVSGRALRERPARSAPGSCPDRHRILVTMLLVTTAPTLPGTTGVRRTRFDPGFFLPSSARPLPPFLASLPGASGFLVQRSFFGGWRRRRSLGLSCSLLLGLLAALVATACRFGLLTHANQLRFARLLRFQLAPEYRAIGCMAAILLLTGTQLGFTDDRGACRRAWGRRGNLRCPGNSTWNFNHRLTSIGSGSGSITGTISITGSGHRFRLGASSITGTFVPILRHQQSLLPAADRPPSRLTSTRFLRTST
jgi:hypothetical protein